MTLAEQHGYGYGYGMGLFFIRLVAGLSHGGILCTTGVAQGPIMVQFRLHRTTWPLVNDPAPGSNTGYRVCHLAHESRGCPIYVRLYQTKDFLTLKHKFCHRPSSGVVPRSYASFCTPCDRGTYA